MPEDIPLSLPTMHCTLIGAPVALGQKLEGVQSGPRALHAAGLVGCLKALNYTISDKIGETCSSEKDVESCVAEQSCADAPTQSTMSGSSPVQSPTQRACPAAVYEEPAEWVSKMILTGQGCGDVHRSVYDSAVSRTGKILTVGGDHSVAAATIGAMLRVHHENLRVIWVDAHADINVPEQSPSKNYHGMPVAHLMGLIERSIPGFRWMDNVPLLEPHQIAYLGLRSIDAGERETLKRRNISVHTMHDISRSGIAVCLKEALEALRLNTDPDAVLHLSFDIDACDPEIAPGTGTRCRGGLTYREAMYICRELAATQKMVSMDMVEINPALDEEDTVLHGDEDEISPTATKTVRLGLDLIMSAFGKTLL